ncbi:MAG: T9SS type A sorting domain-containing protein [Phycisphaerae bacterium]|nr:T9SS type A sorting domain-containing protein [Phycisphaerae bacterium]
MKTFFAQAQYPNVTPNGVPEAVFLDTVVYYDNGQLPSGGTHAPASLLWDGQWGFTGDPNAINYFRNIVLGQNNGMDWALLHELGHQLGLIDLYNQDVQESELQVVEPRTGQRPPLQPVAWDVLYYSSRQPYLMHTNFQAGLSDHSAGGLMRNLSQRRGYFGDYLADIPDDNTLIIERPNGNRVGNADIWVYQQQDNTVPNIPKFRGQTDSVGAYLFPHTTDSLYEGGISVANPFSTIYSPSPHVVGTNSVLFVRVAKGDSVGYGFIDVCDFNVAYWAGHQNSASYTLTISQWFHMPATGIDDKSNVVPKTYELFQNYPNPFNPSTQIKYQLPRPSQVRLVIYNVLGEKIHTLVDTKQSAGVYSVTWDGRSESGVAQGSGVYIYRLTAADKVFVRKALLIK